MISRRSVSPRSACIALAMILTGCPDSTSTSNPTATATAASTATAKPSASATSTPTASATASAAAAPIDTASFGPDISKTAVEAINASAAFESNQPQHALDGKPTTSWSAPSTEKPWLEISLLPGTKVDGIELGGQRTDKTGTEERWNANGVIKRARVVWDGGQGELAFARATDKGVRKRLGIGQVTRRVRIEVLEVEPGTKSADIDVDELGIFGAAPEIKPADPKGLTDLCKAGRLAVRFKDGAVYGGEWTVKPADGDLAAKENPWRWTFWEIKPRVDDGEWHTLGVRYVEEKEEGPDGEKVVKTKNAGKIFRFRVGPDGFEADEDGVKAKGKCEKAVDTNAPVNLGVETKVSR